MAIKSATCPNCGAALSLDDSLEKGFCNHCNSVIIVDDAIQKVKVMVSGEVKMTGVSSAENDILFGNECLAAKDWDMALQLFISALGKKADNYQAWFGCLKAYTHNLKTVNESLLSIRGVYSITSVVSNSIEYAPKKMKRKIANDIRILLNKINDSETAKYNARIVEIHEEYLKLKNKLILHFALALSFIMLSFILFIAKGIMGFIFIIPFIVFASKTSKTNKLCRKYKTMTPTKNENLIKLIYKMDKAVNEQVGA